MRIDTWYSFAATRMSTGLTGRASLIGTVLGSESRFGPPALVSIGSGIPEFAGFTDYSPLAASGTWQFDLAALQAPAETAPMPLKQRSAQQIRAESDLLRKAYEQVDARAYDQARQLMDQLLADNKTNARAYHVLGLVEQGEGHYEAAAQQFRKAHAFEPSSGYDRDAELATTLREDDDTVLRRAQAIMGSPQRRADGLQLLVALTERSPDRADAHLLLGEELLRDNDTLNGMMQYNAAIRTADAPMRRVLGERLRALAGRYPRSGYVQQMIGKLQSAEGQFEQAIQTLSRAAEMMREAAPDSVLDQSDLGAAYLGLGSQQLTRREYGLAVSNLERARELAPRHREAKLALAEAYLERGTHLMNRRRYDEALADYRRLGDLAGKETKAREWLDEGARRAFSIGKTYENKRKASNGTSYDQEAAAFEVAFTLAPENADYKKQLAETRNSEGDQLFQEKKFAAAAAAYGKAYKLYGGNETYRANTIKAWLADGDDRLYNLNFSDAIESYREAYRIDPKHAEARSKLANGYYRRGLDFLEQEDYKSAAKDFREAYDLFPDNEQYKSYYQRYKSWLET